MQQRSLPQPQSSICYREGLTQIFARWDGGGVPTFPGSVPLQSLGVIPGGGGGGGGGRLILPVLYDIVTVVGLLVGHVGMATRFVLTMMLLVCCYFCHTCLHIPHPHSSHILTSHTDGWVHSTLPCSSGGQCFHLSGATGGWGRSPASRGPTATVSPTHCCT